MTFLNPFWLLLAPMLGLPLLIHFFNRRFPHTVYFSTLRNLKKAISERSKIFKWRHWILLILRTVMILLLLLAFLEPVRDQFQQNPGSNASRHVLLLIDRSLSMEWDGAGSTNRQRAIEEACRVLDNLNPSDAVNVVEVGRTPAMWAQAFSNVHSAAAEHLRNLGPGYTSADFAAANARVAELFGQVSGPKDIYYFSDFQRSSWTSAGLDTLPTGVRLYFVNVAANPGENHAVTKAAPPSGPCLAGDTVTVEATVANYSPRPLRKALHVYLNDKKLPQIPVEIEPWSEVPVQVPLTITSTGPQQCRLALDPDSIPADDSRTVILNVLDREEVLIVSDQPEADKSAGYFLAAAMNPFEDETGSLVVRRAPSAQLSPTDLVRTNKVFLTGINVLPPPAIAGLAEFLKAGGSVTYFLDGEQDATNLGKLDEALGKNQLPLKLGSKQNAANLPGGIQQIASGDFKSDMLRLFKGPQRQNLALLNFHEYYQAAGSGAGKVLLAFADGTPALATAHTGVGRILLCNFSLDQVRSNFARQRLFPAWVQDLVKLLDRDDEIASEYLVGDTIVADVWKSDLRRASFLNPEGRKVEVQKEFTGERCRVAIPTNLPGTYSLSSDKPLYAFAANCDASESDLRQLDKNSLPSQAAEGLQAFEISSGADLEQMRKGAPLYHYFILALLGLLLVELAMFHLIHRKVAT